MVGLHYLWLQDGIIWKLQNFFLEKKVNVNAQIHCNNGKNNCSEKGQTALLFATENGNLELVNLLF